MMKPVLVSIVLSFVLVFVIYVWQNRKDISKRGMLFDAPYPPPNPTYLELRDQILKGSRSKFGLPAASNPGDPWGVMMDWGVTNGTATVVALADGSASIYTSSGGGSIGGGQSHDQIRLAAREAVAAAAQSRSLLHPTASFLLPQRREVTFYVLTDERVLANTALVKELQARQHPLTALSDAMQTVISQYRMLQTGK